MSYESFVQAVETSLPTTNNNNNSSYTSTNTGSSFDSTTSNIIYEVFWECNLPLTDRKDFSPTPKEFLPFVFNDSF